MKLRKYTNIFSGLTDAGVETVNHFKGKSESTLKNLEHLRNQENLKNLKESEELKGKL